MYTPYHELGGYRVLRELATGRTFLASGVGERPVVLKMLEADCLLDRQLHPSIRLRLARVRELPEKSVANLHALERDGDVVYLVWQWVEGHSFIEAARQRGDMARLARELALAVESMHAAGIVHGAIHDGNVIVDERGNVRLTHVSPLLWSDPRQDWSAVVKLLREACARVGDRSLSQAMEQIDADNISLRELSLRLSMSSRAGEMSDDGSRGRGRDDLEIRKRSVVGAVAAALLGLAIAVGVYWYVNAGATLVSP